MPEEGEKRRSPTYGQATHEIALMLRRWTSDDMVKGAALVVAQLWGIGASRVLLDAIAEAKSITTGEGD